MHAVSDSQATSLDDLSSSSQAQDWGAGVRLGVQLARQAVQLAYAKVQPRQQWAFVEFLLYETGTLGRRRLIAAGCDQRRPRQVHA